MTGQYFENHPGLPSKPHSIQLALPDLRVELHADSGVFSARSVDPGTLELLKATRPPSQAGVLLDLGCGYGPIACALSTRSPESTVWAIDVNDRALQLTATNADALGLTNVRVARPDEVPEGLTFTGIWSNPPIRVGKDALHEMLQRWLPRLDAGCAAWLVVHRHLGSDSLAVWMTGLGWQVTRIGSKRGYRILKVVPAP
jgi:16S rRNA (guanine1207-N2)-methyltransferase